MNFSKNFYEVSILNNNFFNKNGKEFKISIFICNSNNKKYEHILLEEWIFQLEEI